jgi:predicted RNase H-like nuclease
MYDLLPQNKRVSARWTKAFKSWSLIAYSMNREAMIEYVKRQDNFFEIADLVSYEMQENGFNFYVASPPLVIPNKSLASNIRTVKNYETTKSVLLMGINENDYK